MSWKYVLIGLSLVVLGNLLIVEGRESHRSGASSDDESEGLSSLLNYFRQARLEHQPYDTDDEVSNDDQAIQDLKEEIDNIIPDEPPTPKNPHQTGSSDDGGGGGGGGDELDKAAESGPKALPLSHNGGTGGGLSDTTSRKGGILFIMIVTGCTMLGAIAMVGAGVCWYKYHKGSKAAGVVDYPAYGVTGPTKDQIPTPGDRKLAQSAQMYHYQHQKQQMIAMEKANGSMKHDASDEESEEDNVEGDYTVYECPGLAPTGEMEVKNPLFRGDETPSTTPVNEEAPPPHHPHSQ